MSDAERLLQAINNHIPSAETAKAVQDALWDWIMIRGIQVVLFILAVVVLYFIVLFGMWTVAIVAEKVFHFEHDVAYYYVGETIEKGKCFVKWVFSKG